MNEENKTQDDGYQEIDVSKPPQEEPEKEGISKGPEGIRTQVPEGDPVFP